jgi:uncharacterized protein YdeI (YjbR/CyaY-like superfamily)
MTKRHEFSAVIENGDGGGMFVTIPFDVEKAFGQKRVKVLATFDGEAYRGSLVRMGTTAHLLLLRKDIRQKIGKSAGDKVRVTVEEDTVPRVVTVPKELKSALARDQEAGEFFAALSYTHQREYVEWIESAVRAETRQTRVKKTIEMLREGKKAR